MNGNKNSLMNELRNGGLLRPLSNLDLSLVLNWRNSDRVRTMMYTDSIISETEHHEWFERAQITRHVLSYVFEFDHKPAGVVNFAQFDERRERCTWGFYLGRDDLPQGTGTLMGQLALQLAFTELGVIKLCGECFVYNNASISYHHRLGFHEEGRFCRHVWKNGRYEDVVCFAKFHDEE